jgi:biopolymer transport protein ExbB
MNFRRVGISISIPPALLLAAWTVSAWAQQAAPADAPATSPAPPEAAAPALPTAPAAVPPSLPEVGAALLPQDLSPWGMFMSADIVVKAVMIGLAFASLVTWTVWLTKWIELRAARRKARKRLKILQRSRTLGDADQQIGEARDAVALLVQAAGEEIRMSGDLGREGIKERIVWQLERIEGAMSRKILRGTGVLATIGATAPFVGLFGTVWGIMNSFIGISKAHTTNLAVVAPGIAEALLATALGLVAAIPAVVIYNVFARSISGYRGLLGDGSALVMRLVSRDLDRRTMPLVRAAE